MVLLMPFCSLFSQCFVIMFFLCFSFSLFLCDLMLSCSVVHELLSGDFFVCIDSIFSLFGYHEVYTKHIYDSLFSVDNFKCIMNPYIFFSHFFLFMVSHLYCVSSNKFFSDIIFNIICNCFLNLHICRNVTDLPTIITLEYSILICIFAFTSESETFTYFFHIFFCYQLESFCCSLNKSS